MSLTNFNNDRSVNRIALCSAVVAGFAYVGYSVVRSAFNQRRKRRGDVQEGQHQVLLRRLSQTTQTDTLLGDIDLHGTNKIIIRPKSVQDRIKELNVRAREFADAVVAIQNNGAFRPNGVNARSLQVCSNRTTIQILLIRSQTVIVNLPRLPRGHRPGF